MTIHRPVHAYLTEAASEHHRYRSWEHCYRYFRRHRHSGTAAERNDAALQLGFYLASWGMYRGASFLLQHTYMVHRPVVRVIAKPKFDGLWQVDFGAEADDAGLVPAILELIDAVRDAYKPFTTGWGAEQATDTLVTKVILGTVGCLPACDRFFVNGFRSQGFPYSDLNEEFVERLLDFSQQHLRGLRREQANIRSGGGCHYPLMKLVDMYFWQIGYEKRPRSGRSVSRS